MVLRDVLQEHLFLGGASKETSFTETSKQGAKKGS
jgi:hypothetical protein